MAHLILDQLENYLSTAQRNRLLSWGGGNQMKYYLLQKKGSSRVSFQGGVEGGGITHSMH